MEAGVRAIAGEHLLDGDAGVPGPEEVDEPVRGDRVGAESRDLADGFALTLEPVEEVFGGRVGSVLTSTSSEEGAERWSATR